MKRTLLLVIGISLSIIVKAQASSAAKASISATIINPVGTVMVEDATTNVDIKKHIKLLNETDRILMEKSLQKRKIHVLDQGYIFDIAIDLRAAIARGDLKLRPCDIIVHFN